MNNVEEMISKTWRDIAEIRISKNDHKKDCPATEDIWILGVHNEPVIRMHNPLQLGCEACEQLMASETQLQEAQRLMQEALVLAKKASSNLSAINYW